MAKNYNIPEDEIVDWIVKLIEDKELCNNIQGIEEIDRLVSTFAQENIIPAFGIDHLSRRANARAAQSVIKNLGLLEVVSIDLSISLTTGEILRPDILCFNVETQSFVIFEVKRDRLTERQAMTELAGYEQELRNALPFLGDFDINFVVISTEWDPLLDHAVANFNTWSAKYCLAIELVADARPLSLKCRLPDAWQLRGAIGLPEEGLQTIDVYFEPIASDEQDFIEDVEIGIPPTLITATNALARAGDRLGSHGFVMLWRDHSDYSEGQWAWTLCGVDPLSMYEWCCSQGLKIRESNLSRFLDRQAEIGSKLVPQAVYRIAKESFPILRNRYKPMFDGAHSWSTKLSIIRDRSEPCYFEFWGILGDYSRDFVSQAVVRDRYMPFIGRNEVDWTVPEVALPLLASISEDNPFPEGLIRCSAAFNCGVKLGLYAVLAANAENQSNPTTRLESLVRWSFLEALRVTIEMVDIYSVAKEVGQPPPHLSSSKELQSSSINKLSEWVIEHLIGNDHPIHQMCFSIGHYGSIYFSDWLNEIETNQFVIEEGANIAALIRNLLSPIIKLANEFDQDIESIKSLSRLLKRIDINNTDPELFENELKLVSDISLLEAFKEEKGLSFDEVVLPVLHTVAPLPEVEIDWIGLKKSIKAIYDSGCGHPAVLVDQSGMLGVGKLGGVMAKVFSPIEDPEKEVYFQDTRSFAVTGVRLSWSELQERFKNQDI